MKNDATSVSPKVDLIMVDKLSSSHKKTVDDMICDIGTIIILEILLKSEIILLEKMCCSLYSIMCQIIHFNLCTEKKVFPSKFKKQYI